MKANPENRTIRQQMARNRTKQHHETCKIRAVVLATFSAFFLSLPAEAQERQYTPKDWASAVLKGGPNLNLFAAQVGTAHRAFLAIGNAQGLFWDGLDCQEEKSKDMAIKHAEFVTSSDSAAWTRGYEDVNVLANDMAISTVVHRCPEAEELFSTEKP